MASLRWPPGHCALLMLPLSTTCHGTKVQRSRMRNVYNESCSWSTQFELLNYRPLTTLRDGLNTAASGARQGYGSQFRAINPPHGQGLGSNVPVCLS